MTTEQPEALRLADWHKAMADEPKRNESKREKHRRTEAELRRLHAELEELHAECRVLVRQNGEWQAKVEADEALLQQALAALQYASSQLPLPHAREIEPTIKRLEERLK
jgi:uncharacterized protein YlxW (UPF0749 family)